MHYHAEVWLPSKSGVELAIATVLEPHVEIYNEDTDSSSGFWDWYQIGGRWTGEHQPDYDPEADPVNIELCDLCDGTGFRNDAVVRHDLKSDPTYTCNGCGEFNREKKVWGHGPHGPGKRVKWPSSWTRFEGDVISVTNIRDDLNCYTLVVGDQVFHKQEWNGTEFRETGFDGYVARKLKELGVTHGYLVTVDYHC